MLLLGNSHVLRACSKARHKEQSIRTLPGRAQPCYHYHACTTRLSQYSQTAVFEGEGEKVRKRRESIQVQYAAVLERCSDFWSAKSGLVASTRFDLERTPVSARSDCATSLYTGSSTHYTIGSVTLSNGFFHKKVFLKKKRQQKQAHQHDTFTDLN